MMCPYWPEASYWRRKGMHSYKYTKIEFFEDQIRVCLLGTKSCNHLRIILTSKLNLTSSLACSTFIPDLFILLVFALFCFYETVLLCGLGWLWSHTLLPCLQSTGYRSVTFLMTLVSLSLASSKPEFSWLHSHLCLTFTHLVLSIVLNVYLVYLLHSY